MSRRISSEGLARALDAREWVKIPAWPGRRNDVPAAILVPLVFEGAPMAILTERPTTMRDHPGEITFPGGKPEPGDADLEATAVREAREELGIEAPRILGRLSSFPLVTSDFRLEPFVGVLDDARLEVNEDEVARVLRLDLMELLARPFLHGIEWRGGGFPHVAPTFELGSGFVFGGTAAVLYELLCVMAGLAETRVPPLRTGAYDWPDVMPSTTPRP